MEKITTDAREAIAHLFAGSTVRYITPRGHALLLRYTPDLYVTVNDAGSARQIARIHDPIVTWNGEVRPVLLRSELAPEEPGNRAKIKCETKSQALEWIAFWRDRA